MRALLVFQAVGPTQGRGPVTGALRVLVMVEMLLTREFNARFSRDSRLRSTAIFTKAFVAVNFTSVMKAMAGLDPPSTGELISTLLHEAIRVDQGSEIA
jgi:carbamoylphosphate synthase large subunit